MEFLMAEFRRQHSSWKKELWILFTYKIYLLLWNFQDVSVFEILTALSNSGWDCLGTSKATVITLTNPPIWHNRNMTETQRPKEVQEKLKPFPWTSDRDAPRLNSALFRGSYAVSLFTPKLPLEPGEERVTPKSSFSPSLPSVCSIICDKLQTAVLYPFPASFDVPQVC